MLYELPLVKAVSPLKRIPVETCTTASDSSPGGLGERKFRGSVNSGSGHVLKGSPYECTRSG